jgi:molybdate transport system permease protein
VLVITLVEIPLVLPPTVAGIGLLAAFAGRIGLLSSILDPLGVNVVFTTTAVVLAICFVAGPFYIRQAIAAFETLDRDVLDAARVDGASQMRLLTSISIPLCSAGLAAGAALAFARGVGEFGATIMFAGNLRGVTQTLPLLIYQDFELSFDLALAISSLLVVVSAAVLITVKLVSRLPGRARGADAVFFASASRSDL